MCGITGYVSQGQKPFIQEEIADRMCKVIRHRGPDDQGMYFKAPVFIGMRRLSIIDLETGNQPIHNEDKSIWLVFNGEIYNFHELRQDLIEKGHTFYTKGDAEVIVHAYEEYGNDCFSQLRGMFAIAIWDSKHQRLVLARDHLGKKPLFYSHQQDALIFGSELKSLLQNSELSFNLHNDSIRDFLLYGYTATPCSIFSEVNKLPPGHYLVYEKNSIHISQYWKISFSPKWQKSQDELLDDLDTILDESVRLRCISDVPFGAFLSGGLDSSIVVAKMAKHLHNPVKTFSIGFEEAEFNELDDARRIAKAYNTEHHEFIVRADDVSLLEKLVWYFDEPFADSSAIPTYLVCKMAASEVKMVLSGDGGDEAFTGYDRYRKYAILRSIMKRTLGLGHIAGKLSGQLIPGPLGKRIKWLGERLSMPFPADYISGVALSTEHTVKQMLNSVSFEKDPYSAISRHFENKKISEMDKIVLGDIHSYLLDDILVKVDRMSMANSLEVRSPLLDYKLMEFSSRLPVDLKYKDGKGKVLLREIAKQYLPDGALSKKKQGFAIPLAHWFRTSLKDMMWDLINSQSFRERGIFNHQFAEKLMNKHQNNIQDHSEHLWLMLTFEMWAKQYVDQRFDQTTSSSPVAEPV